MGRLVGKQAGQLRDKLQDIPLDRPPAALLGRLMDRLVRAMEVMLSSTRRSQHTTLHSKLSKSMLSRLTRGLPGHKQRLVEVLSQLRLLLRPLRHGSKVAVLGRLVGKQAGQLRDKQDILQDGPQALLDRPMDRLVRAMDKVQLGAMKLLEVQLEAVELQNGQREAMKLQKPQRQAMNVQKVQLEAVRLQKVQLEAAKLGFGVGAAARATMEL